MNEKMIEKKKQYLPMEIDVRIVDDSDVITTSSPVVITAEHDNAYYGSRSFK